MPARGEELVGHRWLALRVARRPPRADARERRHVRLRRARRRAPASRCSARPAYAGHPVDDVTPIVRQDRFEPREDQGEHVFRFWLNAGPAARRLAAIDREATVRTEGRWPWCAFPPGGGSPAPRPGVLSRRGRPDGRAEDERGRHARSSCGCSRPTGIGTATTLRVPALDVVVRRRTRPLRAARRSRSTSPRGSRHRDRPARAEPRAAMSAQPLAPGRRPDGRHRRLRLLLPADAARAGAARQRAPRRRRRPGGKAVARLAEGARARRPRVPDDVEAFYARRPPRRSRRRRVADPVPRAADRAPRSRNGIARPLRQAARRHGPGGCTRSSPRATGLATLGHDRLPVVLLDGHPGAEARHPRRAFGRPRRFSTLCCWPRDLAYYRRNTWAGRLRDPDTGGWVLDSPANNAMAHFLHNLLYLAGERPDRSALARSRWRPSCTAPIRSRRRDTVACRVATPTRGSRCSSTPRTSPTTPIEPRFRLEFDDGGGALRFARKADRRESSCGPAEGVRRAGRHPAVPEAVRGDRGRPPSGPRDRLRPRSRRGADGRRRDAARDRRRSHPSPPATIAGGEADGRLACARLGGAPWRAAHERGLLGPRELNAAPADRRHEVR